ncbi:MAG: hypothetical protein U0792_03695 [Gemmataceae bacterium]
MRGLPGPEAPNGYVYQPEFSVDYELRGPARPYTPQPGDIYLATEDWFIARFGHLTVKSGAPHHSGIVFAMPDGRLMLLEGGPDSTLWIRSLDVIPRLAHYSDTKRVWIRQRAVPLTPEQSCKLTAFALAATDRHFAAVRMVKERSFFRAKGPLRTPLLHRAQATGFDPNNPEPYMRKKYFCSELVTEACVAAELIDGHTARPTSMYPRELFFGTSRIPYIRNHLDMSEWFAPTRWTPEPYVQPSIKRRPFIDGDADSIRRSP